jgi:predicted membrane protein DUF2231
VFETFLGLPAHPLIVHAAAVFVPLMIAAAVAYALVPRVRRPIGWLVLTLAVVGPAAAWAARLSGDAFRARLIRKRYATATLLKNLDVHRGYAYLTSWYTLLLGVLMVVLILAHRTRSLGVDPDTAAQASPAVVLPLPPVLDVILIVLVIAASVVTGYYIFRTGDTGAHIVWKGL